MTLVEYTTLEKVWYKHVTGRKNHKEHLELKYVCSSCHCVWDRQGYVFKFCPGCRRTVVQEG